MLALMSAESGSRGTVKMPREQRERLILEAAREEFGALGFGGASLGSIAARAGVSKALIVAYFGSKDELYAACADRAGRNLTVRIEQVITTEQKPGTMAQQTLAAIFEALEGRQKDWHVLNDRTVPPGTVGHEAARRQRRTIAEQASRGVANLSQFQTLHPEDREILTAVWMSAVTAVLDWWLRHPHETVDSMMHHCLSVFGALAHF